MSELKLRSRVKPALKLRTREEKPVLRTRKTEPVRPVLKQRSVRDMRLAHLKRKIVVFVLNGYTVVQLLGHPSIGNEKQCFLFEEGDYGYYTGVDIHRSDMVKQDFSYLSDEEIETLARLIG